MNKPPSEELRRRVWEDRIGAHARNIYFARLAARYRRLERWLGVATAVFASATVTAALGWLGMQPLWPALLTGVSGILVGALRFGESSLAMVSHSVAWAGLYNRLDDIWIEIESGGMDHEAVRQSLAGIHEHELYIDRDTAAEPERMRLLAKSLDQAESLAS